MIEHLVHRAGLDDAASLHHGDAVAHMLDDAEIMRNEQHGHAQPRLQSDQEIQHLGLCHDVERRDRLIADHQVRFRGERLCDRNALSLAAGQSGGPPGEQIQRQVYEIDQLHNPVTARFPVEIAAQAQRLRDDALHGVARIERAERILHDGLDPRTQGTVLLIPRACSTSVP